MTLGDFASLVQLGVGLHAGTALLQSITELTESPLERRLSRLHRIAALKLQSGPNGQDLYDHASDLIGDLEVKKVQFFNEYKEVVAVNGGFAIALALLLAAIAFLSGAEIHMIIGLLIAIFSLAPASASLLFLWSRWRSNTEVLRASIETLHKQLFNVA
ncbi:hypothetical protein [Bradyrhizobium quebecense]|uniref:Uncharacterized protein n=2 Tax=Bradyrhizobium quebecense TaxID=2748629 RepID=A0ACD3VC70_9BRAD|nr:hypothetical protein [Bradyrhizobium quebecense]UGY04098.1 hypothetical protein J4P68_0004845 [Bradyrhizobium quebecense]